MARVDYNKTMFCVAAIWNWLAAGVVLFATPLLHSRYGISVPFDPLGGQFFCMFVALFGYGYWLVARDPTRNEGIVILGVIGKVLVFALLMTYAITGRVQLAVALPTSIDALFAILFVEFLMSGRPVAAKSA